MEQIKLTQTQALSSASSAVGESTDSPALVLATIDEMVIADTTTIWFIRNDNCRCK